VTRACRKDGVITTYDGEKLADKFAAAECKVQTHILHMSAAREGQLGQDVYIDGDRVPVDGRGGGSFANHQNHKDCNGKFVLRDGVVYVLATREMFTGEEVYVHCGSDEEVMMGRKRRVITANIDGGRSIATVPISDLEAPTQAWEAATVAWKESVAAVSKAQGKFDARKKILIEESTKLSTRQKTAAKQKEGSENARRLNEECEAIEITVDAARQATEMARAALEALQAEERQRNGAVDAAVAALNAADARRRGAQDKWNELHTRGATIFRADEDPLALPTVEEVLSQTKFANIINDGHDAKGNAKPPPDDVKGRRTSGRAAVSNPKNDAAWVAPFETETMPGWLGPDGLNWLATTTGSAKTVAAAHALKAGVDDVDRPATTPEQKPLHADSCVPNSHAKARAPWGDAHLAMIVALEDNTPLHIYPFDKGGVRETIILNAGDRVVFRGDLIHCGAAYDKRNVRIHCFLDSTAPTVVQRDPDDTFPVAASGASAYWPI
jgi:hypothetical protein